MGISADKPHSLKNIKIRSGQLTKSQHRLLNIEIIELNTYIEL